MPPSLLWKDAWGRIQIRSLKWCRLKIASAGSDSFCKAVRRKHTGFASRGNLLSAHTFRRHSFCSLYERLTSFFPFCVSEGNGSQFKYSLTFSFLSSQCFISCLFITPRNVPISDRRQWTHWHVLLNTLASCQPSDHFCSSLHRSLCENMPNRGILVSLLESGVLQMKPFRN